MKPILILILTLATALGVPAQEPSGSGPPHVPEGYVLIEGDLLIPEEQALSESLYSGLLWNTAGVLGRVPFRFDDGVTSSNRDAMREAMAELSAVSRVTFVEYSGSVPTQHLFIRNSPQNYNYATGIGMPSSGYIEIAIVSWSSRYIICHELMHALGCHHEQSRPDRDAYVTINSANIQPGFGSQFNTHNGTTYGPYDFDSIMHYGSYSFSVCTAPGGPPCSATTRTITCLPAYQQYQAGIGQLLHLSIQDATALAARYGTPLPPVLSSLTVSAIPSGSGDFQFSVLGSGFFAGSKNTLGVNGTRVLWNGAAMLTSFNDASSVEVTIPAALLAVPGMATIQVDNPYPAGGVSNSMTVTISDGRTGILVSEVALTSPRAVEVTNYGTVASSLDNCFVLWKRGAIIRSTPSLPPITLLPGESAVFADPADAGSSAFPPGVQVFFNLGTQGFASTDTDSIALQSASGAWIDEVRIENRLSGTTPSGLSGVFHGVVRRATHTGAPGESVERIWGLDSNGGSDWTAENRSSLGRENRSGGPRGTDELTSVPWNPVPAIVINEIDDNPDFIEVRNNGLALVDLRDWYFVCSARQNLAPVTIRPWPVSTPIASGGYAVIGEGGIPFEMPGPVPYVDILALGFNIPFNTEEFTCALYDRTGRLADLLRTTGHDDAVVHNHPRLPSLWSDFTGAAGRNANTGDQSIGRDAAGTDTNRGSDWRPVQVRTMGMANSGFAGPPGLGDVLDLRINGTPFSGGLCMILNAGPAMAGRRYSLFSSYSHLNGQGPLLGLGFDALSNWVLAHGNEPWGAILDNRGSWRFDLPPGTLGPQVGDHIAILQDPASGAIVAMTRVLEEDH